MIGKNLRKNNLTVTLNISYTKTKKIYPAYVSNGEGWHYRVVKNYLRY